MAKRSKGLSVEVENLELLAFTMREGEGAQQVDVTYHVYAPVGMIKKGGRYRIVGIRTIDPPVYAKPIVQDE